MSLSEEQLTTWSHQGAVTTAKSTHESIRNAISRFKWPVSKLDCFLQGSYRNDTNIYGNSDVDLVVENQSSFFSNLTEEEKLQMGIVSAAYDFRSFRSDVIRALTDYYGLNNVDSSGAKSVKVIGGNGRLDADVVVCCEYRLYRNREVIATGIAFINQRTNDLVINYPQLHYKNGVAKNSASRTNGWYKPSVRMFKNARSRIVESKPHLAARFPSYFVECLLYNVDDSFYGISYQSTYLGCIHYLRVLFNKGSASDLKCQNDIDQLFGVSSTQWQEEDARCLVNELFDLWG